MVTNPSFNIQWAKLSVEKRGIPLNKKKKKPGKDLKHAQIGCFDLGGYSNKKPWLAIILEKKSQVSQK